MNKTELIEAVAAKTGLSKKDVGSAFDGLRDTIHEQLKAGEEVMLHGVGKFVNFRSKEKAGRNPKTGNHITIAARNYAKFRSAKVLDDTLNE